METPEIRPVKHSLSLTKHSHLLPKNHGRASEADDFVPTRFLSKHLNQTHIQTRYEALSWDPNNPYQEAEDLLTVFLQTQAEIRFTGKSYEYILKQALDKLIIRPDFSLTEEEVEELEDFLDENLAHKMKKDEETEFLYIASILFLKGFRADIETGEPPTLKLLEDLIKKDLLRLSNGERELLNKTASYTADQLNEAIIQAHKRYFIPKAQQEAASYSRENRLEPSIIKAHKTLVISHLVKRLAEEVPASGYWKTAAQPFAARLHNYGLLNQAELKGIQRVTFQAVIDKRTTDICRMMHGTTWFTSTVRQAYESLVFVGFDRMIDRSPFAKAKVIEQNPELIRSLTADQIVASNIASPPLHVHCRSRLVFS